jgi:3'(2'), 5'-bisphosphate nucleotidase
MTIDTFSSFDPSRADADDHLLSAVVAEEAGRSLLAMREQAASQSVGGWRLGEHGDIGANRLILERLAAARPDDAVLSEEALDSAARLDASRVWIVDPLDGTREFGEHGRWDWAVHVALAIDGKLAAGAVALPARDMVLSTAEGGLPVVPPAPPTPRMVVSRTRPPSVTEVIRRALGAELVPMGSAGAKAMAVILGEADVYAHAGGQYEWDNAAPAAVAAAAGMWVSRLGGEPLVYNNADPYLPDLLICRPEFAQTVLDAVRSW